MAVDFESVFHTNQIVESSQMGTVTLSCNAGVTVFNSTGTGSPLRETFIFDSNVTANVTPISDPVKTIQRLSFSVPVFNALKTKSVIMNVRFEITKNCSSCPTYIANKFLSFSTTSGTNLPSFSGKVTIGNLHSYGIGPFDINSTCNITTTTTGITSQVFTRSPYTYLPGLSFYVTAPTYTATLMQYSNDANVTFTFRDNDNNQPLYYVDATYRAYIPVSVINGTVSVVIPKDTVFTSATNQTNALLQSNVEADAFRLTWPINVTLTPTTKIS